MSSPGSTNNDSHYSRFNCGPQSALSSLYYVAPNGLRAPGKVFLSEALGVSGAEISWNALMPAEQSPLLHRHRENEEIYLFTGGDGEFRVDDAVFAVTEGTAVHVAPQGARACRNCGEVPLTFIVIQVRPGALKATTISDGVPLGAVPRWPEKD